MATKKNLKKKPLADAVSAAVPTNEIPVDPAPAGIKIEEAGTRMVRQAVADYINRLEPAAREATAAYFERIMPRVVVLSEQQ